MLQISQNTSGQNNFSVLSEKKKKKTVGVTEEDAGVGEMEADDLVLRAAKRSS